MGGHVFHGRVFQSTYMEKLFLQSNANLNSAHKYFIFFLRELVIIIRLKQNRITVYSSNTKIFNHCALTLLFKKNTIPASNSIEGGKNVGKCQNILSFSFCVF